MGSTTGKFGIVGLQIGNIFLAVQPLVGVEGDPMRLLFEKDLTPHPQYTAFYKWLSQEYQPHCMVHYGMHGTVEWLPGSPLGSTASSWPDMLLGNAPNIYVYACNNPSESLLAKRRGYATIVSHNVPPYARAGLYKELAQMKELLTEFRTTAPSATSTTSSTTSFSTKYQPVTSTVLPSVPLTGKASPPATSILLRLLLRNVIFMTICYVPECLQTHHLPKLKTPTILTNPSPLPPPQLKPLRNLSRIDFPVKMRLPY